MSSESPSRGATWFGRAIGPGERCSLNLVVASSFSGAPVHIPVHVWRGKEDGPAVFVTAAVHGDEINGTGAIRELIIHESFVLQRGTLVLVPVVNVLGFERHARYLPDRRDLNRSFPGSAKGSMASRMARVITDELISRCDYGIDLHTASVRRTNFPNVRADMERNDTSRLARAFGCEFILHSKGPQGSLRREATDGGCASILLEAGEVWKVEPVAVGYALRGVRNVLVHLGMVEGHAQTPAHQVVVTKARWLRAEIGGFLQFHVAPGELVEEGQAISTNATLLGQEQKLLRAPHDGVVLGLTTLPSVAPGDPICHLGILGDEFQSLRKAMKRVGTVPSQARIDLATNVFVTEREEADS